MNVNKLSDQAWSVNSDQLEAAFEADCLAPFEKLALIGIVRLAEYERRGDCIEWWCEDLDRLAQFCCFPDSIVKHVLASLEAKGHIRSSPLVFDEDTAIDGYDILVCETCGERGQ